MGGLGKRYDNDSDQRKDKNWKKYFKDA